MNQAPAIALVAVAALSGPPGLAASPAAPGETVATLVYKGGPTVSKTVGSFTIRLASGVRDGKQAVLVHATDNGRKGFDLDLPASEDGRFDVTADIPEVDDPGVAVVTSAANPGWKVSKVVVRTKLRWSDLFVPYVSGAGYRLVDLGHDGKLLLVGVDSSFLDGWDVYGHGKRVAPIRIERRVGIKLVDVTTEPVFRPTVEASLKALEADASDADWHDNGFLAAWAATKVLLDQGQDGWARMLILYGPGRSFMCGQPTSFAHCRKEYEANGEFPALLRRHLLLRGYIADEKIFALPTVGRDGQPTCRRAGAIARGVTCE